MSFKKVSLAKFAKEIGEFAKSHGTCSVVSVGTGIKQSEWYYIVNVMFDDGREDKIEIKCFEK